MRCSSCHYENPQATRFCGNCGTPLNNRCAKYGRDNPPQFKFCGECGAPLQPGSPEPAQGAGGAAPLTILELLRDYFRITAEDDARQRREEVIGKVLGLDHALEHTLPYVFGLLGIQEGDDPLAQMDAQIRRRRTQEALKRILLRESLNQPLILVFEDLHWIDGETQGLLNLLADSIANARILLAVNYRPEYRHEWGHRTHYTQLRHDPLGLP